MSSFSNLVLRSSRVEDMLGENDTLGSLEGWNKELSGEARRKIQARESNIISQS